MEESIKLEKSNSNNEEYSFSLITYNMIKPLLKFDPKKGLMKSIFFLVLFVSFSYVSIFFDFILVKMLFAVLAALIYVGLISMTHDALHLALTGNKIYDEVFGRLVSYPIFHMFGLYSFLHKRHHRENAKKLIDPERYQITGKELQKKSAIAKWLYEKGIIYESIAYGAAGMLLIFYRQAPFSYKWHPHSRKLIVSDLIGIFLFNALIIGFMVSHDLIWDYLLLFILIERITGALHQAVSRFAHNGQWYQYHHFVPNQIANTRTVKGPWIVSCLLNNLNYHQAHHAFPNLPYYELPRATEIIKNNRDEIMPSLEWDCVENYQSLLRDSSASKQYIISEVQE